MHLPLLKQVTSLNQQICRVDRESIADSYAPKLSLLKNALIEKVRSSDLVIISDYGKGFITNELIKLIRNEASFVAVDPKPSRLLEYTEPNLLTPNRLEALELAGVSRLSKQGLIEGDIISEIFQKFSPERLAITMGSEGMLLTENGKLRTTIPTAAREVFDVSGAGDTVIAVLSMAIGCWRRFERSAQLANLAAGLVVAKVGTATVSIEEILALL